VTPAKLLLEDIEEVIELRSGTFRDSFPITERT